jgi:type III secretion protein L
MTSKNIIKANKLQLTDGTQRRTLLKRSVAEAMEEAHQIIEDAKAYSEELRTKVNLEASELLEKAYQEGHEKALTDLNELLIEAREIRDRTLLETEQDILRLAVRLAEKIIGQEIKTDKKVIADIVANALRNTKRQEKLTIRVSQSDYTAIQEQFALLSQSSRSTYVDLVPDPRISLGGCIIESEVGTVDARLETQLKALEKALLGQTEKNEFE